jgi:hypothetical protein
MLEQVVVGSSLARHHLFFGIFEGRLAPTSARVAMVNRPRSSIRFFVMDGVQDTEVNTASVVLDQFCQRKNHLISKVEGVPRGTNLSIQWLSRHFSERS